MKWTKEYRAEYMKRYHQTEKSKKYQVWYRHTEKSLRYHRAWKAKKRLTEEGKIYLAKYARKYRQREVYKKWQYIYNRSEKRKTASRQRARIYRLRKKQRENYYIFEKRFNII